SFGECVAANNELLSFGQFDFDPGTAASAAFVERTQSFGNQPFEAKLLRDPEQVLFRALQTFREPDIWRPFFENVGKEFPSGRKRFLTQIFPIHKEKIEDVINKRPAFLGAFVNLKQLKGRPAFLIERDDLAIKDNLLHGQKLERIKQWRIVKRLVVARDKPHISAILQG